jgi:S1-C subfamily serine protease
MATAYSKEMNAERRFLSGLSSRVVLASMAAIIALVWLSLRLDGQAQVKGPDEGRLVGLAAAPSSGPWLGIDVQPISEILADRLGLPDHRGVIVSYVYPGSPALHGGLAQGDVIRRVGETRLRDSGQLGDLISARRPGDTLRLNVWRRGARKDIRVKLEGRPPGKGASAIPLPEAEVEIEAAWLGLDIVPLSGAEARELGLPAGQHGMLVDGVAAGQGRDAGFQVGDLIVAVNGRSTRTITDFREATEQAIGAVVDAIRYGRHIYLSVPPPGAVGPDDRNASPVQAM